jgi:hypothetical protein
VTEDGLYLIPDHKAGHVKVFEKNGKFLKLVKKFGPKGFGKDEFGKPAYCFYNSDESKFGVIDARIREVYIFDRLGRVNFTPVSTVRKVEGYDMKLAGDGKQLIIAGYMPGKEKKTYELYRINLEKTKQRDYLVSSPEKYGLSDDEYQIEYFGKRTLPAIGIRSFIDVQGDDAYFVWEGKLNIIKINLVTKDKTAFGHKTAHYIEPSATPELLKGRIERDYTKTKNERTRMSFVRDIFATPRHVFVAYEGQNKFRLQVYTPEGTFLDEIAIPGNPGRKMWFDKSSYTLHSFSENSENKEPQILIYKVK